MAKTKNTTQITEENSGKRLDVFVSEFCGITRSQAQKLIKFNAVKIDSELPKKNGQKLEIGNYLEIDLEKLNIEVKKEKTEEDMSLLDSVQIIKETDDYLVIDKPTGLTTHPAQDLEDKKDILKTVSVASWVLKNYPKLFKVGEYTNRPGIVHRLDKDTSGLMVIAKTQQMFDHLKQQFKDRTVEKRYTAFVHGVTDKEHDLINFKISMGNDGKMVARPKLDKLKLKTVTAIQSGKEAVTEFWVKKHFVNYTLLDVKTHTGRTHQIRVHLFAYNHPIVGDKLYFNKKIQKKKDMILDRLFLHSYSLGFVDLGGQIISSEIELPQELELFMKNLTEL